MTDAQLTAEGLLAEAQAQCGLTDPGVRDFEEGLGVLLETYARSGADERRMRREKRRLVQLLATRMKVEAAFQAHPEIRERPIRAPLYLTGFPRTGTSALFNLLGADAAARPLLLWEGVFPDPNPDVPPGAEDPRLTALRAYYEEGAKKNPEFSKIHVARADAPEECVMLQAHTFRDVQMGIEVLIEPYASWFQAQDLRPAYAYYLDLLRLLDWQRPGERWLLKSPAHLWALDILVEQLPDVGIVLTHRDPCESVGSYCSMVWALLDGIGYEKKTEVGPVVLEYLARSMERGLDARERSDEARFLDVDYRELVADRLAVAERIYAHFDLPLPGETADRLRAHCEAHPQNRHGSHDYTLETYGLGPELVRERLSRYVERFDLQFDGPGGSLA
ncbi:MAG: sulfotransferase [Myxococcota bacterium]|nr:sulfotransferase [Myxococcota bacterium]